MRIAFLLGQWHCKRALFLPVPLLFDTNLMPNLISTLKVFLARTKTMEKQTEMMLPLPVTAKVKRLKTKMIMMLSLVGLHLIRTSRKMTLTRMRNTPVEIRILPKAPRTQTLLLRRRPNLYTVAEDTLKLEKKP